MKRIVFYITALILVLVIGRSYGEETPCNGNLSLCLRPGNAELWAVSVDPETINVYDTNTLELLRTHTILGNPIDIAFDLTGTYVYIVVNVPDERRACIRCYDASNFELNSESPIAGIALRVLVHSNGFVYVTSQDPRFDGYIEKFEPVSLGLLANAGTQCWAAAKCFSPFNGFIYIGSPEEYEGDGISEPEVFSKVMIYDPTDLAVVGELHAGLHHKKFIAVDDLLLIENFGFASYDPGFEYLLKGLTVLNVEDETTLLDWQVYPDVLRGSCYEPTNARWYGCTFSSVESTGSQLWMICDLNSPEPIRIEEFPVNRVVSMVAFPIGPDTVRLIGIDSLNEALWVYDADVDP